MSISNEVIDISKAKTVLQNNLMIRYYLVLSIRGLVDKITESWQDYVHWCHTVHYFAN